MLTDTHLSKLIYVDVNEYIIAAKRSRDGSATCAAALLPESHAKRGHAVGPDLVVGEAELPEAAAVHHGGPEHRQRRHVSDHVVLENELRYAPRWHLDHSRLRSRRPWPRLSAVRSHEDAGTLSCGRGARRRSDDSQDAGRRVARPKARSMRSRPRWTSQRATSRPVWLHPCGVACSETTHRHVGVPVSRLGVDLPLL